MSQHYTKNTIADTAYCPQCKRRTLHRVDDRRLGPCIDPDHPVRELSKKQEKRRREQEHERQNPRLF